MSLGAFYEVAAPETGSGPDEDDGGSVFTARQRAWADSTSLKTIARAAAQEPALFVAFVRSRTVAKVDSMGLVVRRRI